MQSDMVNTILIFFFKYLENLNFFTHAQDILDTKFELSRQNQISSEVYLLISKKFSDCLMYFLEELRPDLLKCDGMLEAEGKRARSYLSEEISYQVKAYKDWAKGNLKAVKTGREEG